MRPATLRPSSCRRLTTRPRVWPSPHSPGLFFRMSFGNVNGEQSMGRSCAVSETAIVGLGMTELGKVYDRSPRKFAADAVRAAVVDAGLSLADLDGLIVSSGMSGSPSIEVARALGLRDLRLLTHMSSYGATAVAMVSYAATMIESGAASTVACVFADAPLQPEQSVGSAYHRDADEWHGVSGLQAALGFRSVNAFYALATRRHMQRYGTTSEQLGAIAVATRDWAV